MCTMYKHINRQVIYISNICTDNIFPFFKNKESETKREEMALTRVHIYEKVDSGFKEPVLKSPNQFLSTAPKLPNDKNHPELSLKSLS